MKLVNRILSIAFCVILISSCDLLDPQEEGANDLGGSTDLELTKVGNEYGAYIKINGQDLDLKDSIWISKNDNGIITVKILVEKSDDPLWVLIPEKFKDKDGNVNTELHYKVTSEGIQDYYHSNQDLSKPFTIVKYNGNVGDKYEFTRDDGKKIVREITEKTNIDEFPLGFIYIKTILTEEVVNELGVKKVLTRSNHKFGMVYVEYQFENGATAAITLMPWAVL